MKFFTLLFFLLPFTLTASSIRIMPIGHSITYDDTYSDSPKHGGTPRPEGERHAYRSFLVPSRKLWVIST